MIVNIMILQTTWLFALIFAVTAQYTNIAIVALNDIHGAALPTLMQRQDNNQNYTYGGL